VADTLVEIRDLLEEIRDLLRPVADAHQSAYNRRVAIRSLLSTDKRKEAWALANGEMTQGDIAREAGMDKGSASRFFKELRDLGAVGEGTNPKRAVDL
jgi:superfamily II RNA helicase